LAGDKTGVKTAPGEEAGIIAGLAGKGTENAAVESD
jgi:hypothetical protein